MVTLEVRYDSMDNLLLRKVLDPSRPDHRQLLAGARSASECGLPGCASYMCRAPLNPVIVTHVYT